MQADDDDDDDVDSMWPSMRELQERRSALGMPGDCGSVGSHVPVLFVRIHVCTTGDAVSTELYLRTGTGEVYLA